MAQCPIKGDGKQKREAEKWQEILSSNQLALLFQQLGPVNEDKLEKLKKSKIELNETTLGQQKETKLKKMVAALQHLTFWELDKMEKKLQAAREANNNEIKADKICFCQE